MAGPTAPVNAGYIAPQILAIMEATDKTIPQIGRETGVNPRTLYSTVNSDRAVRLWTALKLCDGCQISADWLLGLTDRQEPQGPPKGMRYSPTPDKATALQNFARNLKKAVARWPGGTAMDLANRMCIESSTIYHHMHGSQVPRTDILAYYCAHLHVSADWLLGRTQWMHANRERHW